MRRYSYLQYKVFYSTSPNLDTPGEVLAGTEATGGWVTDLASFSVSDLADNTLYYFNVVVRDGNGNQVTYTKNSATTLKAVKVFWSEDSSSSIKQAFLDGSGITTVVSGLNGPGDLAIDPTGTYIYWVDRSAKTIQRAPLADTSTIDTLFDNSTDGVDYPYELVLDTTNSLIYWTERRASPNGVVCKGAIDGTGSRTVVLTGLNNPVGLAIDLAAENIYWTEESDNVIMQADLGGPDPDSTQAVVADNGSDGVDGPFGLALDTARGYLYWTEFTTGIVKCIPTSGSGVQTIESGLSVPWGIALLVNNDSDDTAFWAQYQPAGDGSIRKSNIESVSPAQFTNSVNNPTGITIY